MNGLERPPRSRARLHDPNRFGDLRCLESVEDSRQPSRVLGVTSRGQMTVIGSGGRYENLGHEPSLPDTDP